MADGPELESAIVWFEGYDPDSIFFDSAVAAGGFPLLQETEHGPDFRAWPACIEIVPAELSGTLEEKAQRYGRRLGIDVKRRCYVIEMGMNRQDGNGTRVLVNISAAGATLELGRRAIGE